MREREMQALMREARFPKYEKFEPGFFEHIGESYQIADLNAQRGKLYADVLWGKGDFQNALNQSKKIQEKILFMTENEKWPAWYSASGIAGNVAGLSRFMAGGLRESAEQGLKGGILGGGIGFAVGGPGGATAGMSAGALTGVNYGIIKYSADIEGGNIYGDIRERLRAEGLPDEQAHKIAAPISIGAGILIGAIELAQIKGLIPFGKPITKGLLSSSAFKKLIKSAAARYIKNIAEETGQEVSQELATIAANVAANRLAGLKEDIPVRKQFIDSIWDTIKNTAPAMAILAGPRGATMARQNQIVRSLEKGQIQKPTPETLPLFEVQHEPEVLRPPAGVQYQVAPEPEVPKFPGEQYQVAPEPEVPKFPAGEQSVSEPSVEPAIAKTVEGKIAEPVRPKVQAPEIEQTERRKALSASREHKAKEPLSIDSQIQEVEGVMEIEAESIMPEETTEEREMSNAEAEKMKTEEEEGRSIEQGYYKLNYYASPDEKEQGKINTSDDYRVRIEKGTEKAYRVEIDTKPSEFGDEEWQNIETLFLPKSRVEKRGNKIIVPDWLIKKQTNRVRWLMGLDPGWQYEMVRVTEKEPDAQKELEAKKEMVEQQEIQEGKPERKEEVIKAGLLSVVSDSPATYTVQYKVIEADDLIPSHNPKKGFLPNEEYPTKETANISRNIQERDYQNTESYQSDVIQIANNLNPNALLEAPTGGAGAPVVIGDNIVVAGNGRAMALQYAASNKSEASGKRYQEYVEALREYTGQDLSEFEKPVLVRELDAPIEEAIEIARSSSVETKAAPMTQEAIALAEAIPSSVLVNINLPIDQTFRNYLNTVGGKDLVRYVQPLFPRAKQGQFFEGDELLPIGKTVLEDAVLLYVLGDTKLFRALYESQDIRQYKEPLQQALPALLKLKQMQSLHRVSEDWDIVSALRKALWYIQQNPRSGKDIVEWANRPTLQGESLATAPESLEKQLILAIEQTGRYDIKNILRDFANSVPDYEPTAEEIGLFDESDITKSQLESGAEPSVQLGIFPKADLEQSIDPVETLKRIAHKYMRNPVNLYSGLPLNEFFGKLKEIKDIFISRFRRHNNAEPQDPISQELINSFKSLKEIYFQRIDPRLHAAKVEAMNLRKELTQVLGERKYNDRVKLYDFAIQIYIDTKREPSHIQKYWNNLTDSQKEIVNLSQNLPDKVKAIAEKIERSYREIGLEALGEGVIKNIIDNYANRRWKFTGDKNIEWLRKFGVTTRHARHRSLVTIIEGWATKELELEVQGATDNLSLLKIEVGKTIEDKRFLDALTNVKFLRKDENGQVTIPLLTHDVQKARELGYIEVEHPNFKKWAWIGKAEGGEIYKGRQIFIAEDGNVYQKQSYFAPPEQAKNLNRIFGVSVLRRIPALKSVMRVNAIIKNWILQYSYFHHLAFARSYYLGTNHKKWNELNIFSAYKRGMQMVENMNPMITLGVRNGLTLGLKLDWEEDLIREGTKIGEWLDKWGTTKAVKDKILSMRKAHVDWLFGRFGAGLKAKAFVIEYRNRISKYSNPTIETQNEIARQVARLVNDDFGGLHLRRLGRDPTYQDIFRLFFLAPDWTESNVRTMVKAIKSGKKEETAMYRKFWAGVLTKGLTLTMLGNLMIAAWEEDDPKEILEKFVENFKKAWKAGNLRFLEMDITPIYRAIGGKDANRRYFSIIGHFKDPIKFVTHPLRSGKHKGSITFSFLFDCLSGTDWRGWRFTDWDKLVKKGQATEYGTGKPIEFGQAPSYLVYKARNTIPAPLQYILSWATGEMEGFEAIGNALGLGIRRTYSKRKRIIKKPTIKREFPTRKLLQQALKQRKSYRERLKRYAR